MMMQSLVKHKLALTLIGILLLVKFFLLPWHQWLIEKAENINQLRFSQQRLGDISQRNQELELAEQSISQKYDALMQVLGSSQSSANVDLQRHIEAIAVKYKVEITNRLPREVVTTPVTHLPAVYYFNARPEQIAAFIYELERLAPKIIVTKLALNKRGPSSPTLSASVELIMLLKPLEPVAS
ncbi:hypothetical protein [Rheinheimera maricola]|uniref:Type 4a pilus biogenesis protein PilO n=1 Tax=Rheinheimera maricola TaxID=2793282 RepID=A0ABS7X533_9GAMM|nr:hypothetical protein [Rheinheimera maricola]MBZ9610289.1 hypothetical protein [Rheinheimera maricola]